MARIDFAFGAPDRLRMACEVVRKHYKQGRRVLVYTQDGQRLARFDSLLWSFDSTAFIPHVEVQDPLAQTTAVLLAASLPDISAPPFDEKQPPWLLNLDLLCPPRIEGYQRILEIVSNHEADRTAARERWRQYAAQGHELHAHDVSDRELKRSNAAEDSS